MGIVGGVLFALLVLSVPIGIALSAAAAAYIMVDPLLEPNVIFRQFFSFIARYSLTAIPLFIFAGFLMEKTGLIRQLFSFADSLVGWMPGGFGVATVVAKLFNAVQPHNAYFGQKDAQQAAVIRQMARDLSYPIEIVICPIVREPDGLAMSSRNVYLNPKQRKAATVLYRSLSAAKEAYEDGVRDAETLRQIMKDTLASEPLAQVQYVSCTDYDTLEELETVTGKTLLSMAVFIGKTRLIDNLVLE